MDFTFGEQNPREMPTFLFFGAIQLDYTSAIRADISKQNYSVCPRYWYVDATIRCVRCGNEFPFTIDEQQYWYEHLNFWIESFPKHCQPCRSELRQLKALQQEYDRDIKQVLHRDATHDRKQRILEVIDTLTSSGLQLPELIKEKRGILIKQLDR